MIRDHEGLDLESIKLFAIDKDTGVPFDQDYYRKSQIKKCFPNISKDLTITYELVENNNKASEESISKEMTEVLDKTKKVFSFTDNKMIPVWTKMLLFNSNMIKKME